MRNVPHRLVFIALLVLAGCGGILPKPAPEPSLYRLTAATDFAANGRTVPVQLVVEAPAVEAALDTTRIALARTPTTLDYFADAAWTDRVSLLLQSLLIESLDNAHRLAAVGSQTGVLRADAVLVTELRHFEANYAGAGPPRWRIELTAKLVKMPERTILGNRSFKGESEAARNALPEIVDAADTAWHGVATEIAEWAAATLSQPPR
jgi:cholesterol transport system auxiliary component